MARVLVTGGAGYVGAHAVQRLLRRGHQVHVVDNLSRSTDVLIERLDCTYSVLDVRDTDALIQVMQHARFDAVMHFAAFAYVAESVMHPDIYYDNNVRGTLSLLRAMREVGVGKLVFSSTCAVYGDAREHTITETHPCNPVNPYGRSKLMCEQVIADLGRAYGVNFVAFRYFNAAGADPQGLIGELHEPEPHLIPLCLRAADGSLEFVTVHGSDYPTPDGSCVRDFVHVQDLAEAHVRGLEYLLDGGPSDVFNLSSGQGASVLQVLAEIQRVTRRPVPARIAERRPGDPPRLVGNGGHARRVLGWVPSRSELGVIIEDAWRWHRRDRS
jgi:UDP-glucose 4-epimerase